MVSVLPAIKFVHLADETRASVYSTNRIAMERKSDRCFWTFRFTMHPLHLYFSRTQSDVLGTH